MSDLCPWAMDQIDDEDKAAALCAEHCDVECIGFQLYQAQLDAVLEGVEDV